MYQGPYERAYVHLFFFLIDFLKAIDRKNLSYHIHLFLENEFS